MPSFENLPLSDALLMACTIGAISFCVYTLWTA
jgi:hypothetical protein